MSITTEEMNLQKSQVNNKTIVTEGQVIVDVSTINNPDTEVFTLIKENDVITNCVSVQLIATNSFMYMVAVKYKDNSTSFIRFTKSPIYDYEYIVLESSVSAPAYLLENCATKDLTIARANYEEFISSITVQQVLSTTQFKKD